MITVVNYGSGNISAITNIYKRLNIPCVVATGADAIAQATHLVLPGVGAFDATIDQLDRSGMRPMLDKKVLEDHTPVIGVCVGMQIMAKSSEEGQRGGLGWVDAHVRRFDTATLAHKPHIPHLGWNVATPVKPVPLFEGIDVERGFYFLHSYYFECCNDDDVLATTHYGTTFTSSVNAGNVFGVQFHPEKSHQNGIRLFKNFARF
ncbi:imidazole glycerol phosphate synthase subunit HisH [Kordiimonas sp.]|uniref:imidazole glycerol phosphate synthase subunit HisH n=1 Tax=Kordiimonas sp. TaxID=1970157 RepID=UPI003A91D5B9